MQGRNALLDGGQELNLITQKDAYAGSLLRRIILAVNTLANNASVSPIGKLPSPPKIDSVQIQGTQSGNVLTCPSEILHWTLTHNQAVQKGIRYFTEIDTNPGFTQPHVIDHGTGRSGFLNLPTYASAAAQEGTQPTAYYLRSYAQYTGSDPSEPTVFGNLDGSTKIVMTPPLGTSGSATALLSSTGSGTASPQGQQGGKGLGTVQQRPSPKPKRSVGIV